MSDVHKPFWSSTSLRLRAAVFLLIVIVVAAVVGLIERSGGSSDAAAPAPATPAAAVPVGDNSGATPAHAASTHASPTHAAPTPAPTSVPATVTPPATSAPKKTTAATVAPSAPLTYVVKRGDNLSVIAAWFHLHGYGSLYERNRAVIGADPNLIHPGQRITLSGSGVTMSAAPAN